MNGSILRATVDLLHDRWRALLVVAALALGPAVAATSLIEVLGSRTGGIVNGSLVRSDPPWTELVLSAQVSGTQAEVTVPVLVALAWFIGLGVCLRVIAGEPPRLAWRPTRAMAWSWLGLATMLALLAVITVYLFVAAFGVLDGPASPLAVLLVLALVYGLARLVLALPALLVDGYGVRKALRQALAVTRGRALLNGTALLLIGVGPPLVLDRAISSLGVPLGDTWTSDVAWNAIPALLGYLTLLATLPLQATVLFAAYGVASMVAEGAAAPAEEATGPDDDEESTEPDRDEEPAEFEPVELADDDRDLAVWVHDEHDAVVMPDERMPAVAPERSAPALRRRLVAMRRRFVAPRPVEALATSRWLRAVALAALVVMPGLVGPATLLANPNDLPVATVADPRYTLAPRALDLAVLDSGTVAIVDEMQVTLCHDAHCADVELLSMPCYGGVALEPGFYPRSCSIEAPLVAADITPDGTLVALTQGRAGTVRAFWCRLVANADSQCTWGGATTLYQQPELWQGWSMDVTATPGGGFAALFLGPGDGVARGTLQLATCESLDCPQPTVRPVLDTGLIDGYQQGTVAIEADPLTGDLALAYVDRTDGSLWLAGCPAGCADGTTLRQVHTPEVLPRREQLPSVQVLVGSRGPVARLSLREAGDGTRPVATTVACLDRACTTSEVIAGGVLVYATALIREPDGGISLGGVAGTFFVFSNVLEGWGAIHTLQGLGFTRAPEFVNAAFKPDGSLVLLLGDGHRQVLVTCTAGQPCTVP